MNYLQIRKDFRRKLGLDIIRATLGAPDGSLDVPGLPGWVYISYTTSEGLSAKVAARFRATIPKLINMPVIVSYDEDGELAVVKGDFAGQSAAGYNPLANNVADDNVSYFIPQARLLTLNCHIISSSAPTMLVTVEPMPYVLDGTFHFFLGGNGDGATPIDLTSSIPGTTGKQCLAALFLKTSDDTIEVKTSTPIDVGDDFSTADIQECVTASSANSIPVWVWRLYNGMTGLTPGNIPTGDDYFDFRGIVNIPATSGSGLSYDDVVRHVWMGA